jgi:phage putative head morphogenesis protein, SPP1 gp7 family
MAGTASLGDGDAECDEADIPVSFRGWQGEIPESEMVWLRDPDLENPYGRGAGIAEALGDELETDEYAAKHTKTWFYNRAVPELLIGVEQGSEEELKRAKQRWEDEHRGFFRAYRSHWYRGKLDVTQLGQSFQNMQLVELRRFERDTIINVFGVPPEILGIVENSNRATIDASDYLFSRWVLVPRLEFLRAEMQERLVPMFDERLILDYESPVPEDREYNLNVARAAPYAVTVDEFRTMMGLEELPDGKGKVFMVPFSLVPMSSFGGGEGPKPEPTSQPSTPASDDDSEAGEGEGDEGKGATRPGRRKDALPDRLVQDAVEAVSAEHLVFEANPIYKRVLEELGQQFLDDLGLEMRFDLLNPRVIDFLQRKCGLKIRGINKTTRNALRASLAEGVRAGESIPDLAKRVSEVFSQAKGWRATTIARTEVVGASNFANFEAMRQSGVIEEKEWIATRDDRVRDEHLAMDGQIKPINEPFEAPGGERAMYPGDFGLPELDINCRCTTAAVIEGKSYLDTEEKRLAYWQKYDQTIRPYERQFEAAMKRAFQKQQNAVMDVLKNYRGEE